MKLQGKGGVSSFAKNTVWTKKDFNNLKGPENVFSCYEHTFLPKLDQF